jgi:hypothetical protein
MSSKVEICNMALRHLGISKEIANLDTEASQEAASLRRFYEPTRDAVFRDFNWSFTTKIAALALVEETPNLEWGYSYQYPSDCVKARRILSGARTDSRQTRVPYKFIRENDQKLILCDIDSAELEYSERVTNPEAYPPDFVLALSYRLAYIIAPGLTGGDPFQLGQKAYQLYVQELSRAQATALNEEQVDEEMDSEFIRIRG